jgi:hypothetical protein
MEIEKFHPELISPRGQRIAWAFTLLVGAAWVVLILQGQQVPFAVPVLAILLLLAALSISLGNWMDRRTEIQIGNDGITFTNGVRNAQLAWDDIQEVRITPSRWGKKVEVIGTQAHFEFRTLGEVKVQGELKGRLGFPQGEHILKRIVSAAGLKPVKDNRVMGDAPSYYVRE